MFKADVFALHLQDDTLAEALDAIEGAQTIEPDSSLAKVARARLAILENDFIQAERLTREVIAQEPSCDLGESCDLAYVWLGETLWRQNRAPEGLAILDEGTTVGEGRIRCRLKRGQIFEKLGEPFEAISEYREVLRWDSRQTTALNELGAIYLKRNDHAEAASAFRSLFAKTGGPRAAFNLSLALYGQALWKEAIEQLEKADELYRRHNIVSAKPAISIGDAYLEMGHLEEADPWYGKALEIFDKMIEEPRVGFKTRGQRAVCLAKLGRSQEAEAEISNLLPEAETMPELWVYAARIHAFQNDREQLFEMARQAIQAGVAPNRLVEDAAFALYRQDYEYRRLLEPLPTK